MKTGFKKVPALEKSFNILDLMAKSKKSLGISDMSKALDYHKSTVFNIVHTLVELDILEKEPENKFRFGTKLYLLGKAAGNGSGLITAVHPYLEEINQKTGLSSFLGVCSGMGAVILDKVDSAFDIKISSEIGMRIPLLAGAGGKALLSQLSDREVDEILSKTELKGFTPYSCVNKSVYKKMINQARKDGIAIDKGEYIEGVSAFAVPLNIESMDTPAAVWAVGLKQQIKDRDIPVYSEFLKEIAKKIEARFSF